MKKTNRFPIRYMLSVLMGLALLAGLLPAGPTLAASKKPPRLSAGALYLQIEPVCLGEEDEDIPVYVNDSRGYPVAGATITMDRKLAGETNSRGSAVVPYHPKNEGTNTVTFSASKKGYTSSASFRVNVEAKLCTWVVRMTYGESESDSSGKMIFGASMEFGNQEFVVNADGSLSLVDGGSIQAEYHCSVYDLLEVFDYVFEPPVEGTASIQLKGSYKKGVVYVTLTSPSIALPGAVTMQMYDRINPDTKIPPMPFYTYPAADVINKAQIVNMAFTEGHYFRKFKLSQGAFWQLPITTYASGIVVVERLKK